MGGKSQEIDVKQLLSFCDDLVGVLRDINILTHCVDHSNTVLSACDSDFNVTQIAISVLSLNPVIGAIAAGNAIVLKPSEVAPCTSSLLATYIGQYMDSSAVRVVEGGIPETSALQEQKWDKVLYTGLIP